ncbi:MAG: glutamyl-tRNA reductase [SAR324 cluster bacterium]|nr:glutamyl-tRNA reductase [SAR324 cluster bacterium]
MKFAVLGWNYRKTSIEIREQLAIPQTDQLELADRLCRDLALQELSILSTCNRTEFYFVAPNTRSTLGILLKQLIAHYNLPELEELCYPAYDEEAVKHLFRVTSSLDSMIIGEPQIQGQVKTAYQYFLENEYIGSFFKGLFPRAFSTAKRIRTETQIAHFAVSISFAAVELAKRIFSDLSEQTVMIIGAGEMAELAAKHFIKNGVSKLLVTNRTFSNAVILAEQYQGSAIRFEQLSNYLDNADIIIGSTGAHNFIINYDIVKQSIKRRKGRAMFFIDIAVPRDIDPRLNEIANVYSYDIDDLQNIIEDNRKERLRQAELAEDIIEEEAEKLNNWFKTLSAVPAIRALRNSFHQIGFDELEKAFQKLNTLSPEQKEQVERLVHTILHKLLHTPTCNLRKFSNQEDGYLYLDILNQLFELSPPHFSVEESSSTPSLQLIKKKSTSP